MRAGSGGQALRGGDGEVSDVERLARGASSRKCAQRPSQRLQAVSLREGRSSAGRGPPATLLPHASLSQSGSGNAPGDYCDINNGRAGETLLRQSDK